MPRGRPPTVVVDANALMMPVELDVRLFDELERLVGDVDPVAPRAVVEELERVAKTGSGKASVAAIVALELADGRCRIVAEDDRRSHADDVIVDVARRGGADYVVTNDAALRNRLLAEDVPVIGIRGRNKLAINRP